MGSYKRDGEFILVINQLDAQNLFYITFISCLYMFRAPCARRQEVKIVLYSLRYHHTYRCDDSTAVLQPETRALLKTSHTKSPTHNELRKRRPMW